MKHYCFLLLPEFSNLCLFNSIEPLRAANSFTSEPVYRWSLASLDGQSVRSSSEFDINVTTTIDDAINSGDVDALIILASYNYKLHTSPDVIKKLRLARQHIPVLGGFDAGSYPLAKAGLLDGYKATIHWAEVDTFSEEFHKVDVCNNRYVLDRSRITSGGATAALDLMLAIIRRDHGAEVAISVSDLLIFDTERSESTPQRERVPSMIEQQSPRLARAIRLMEQNCELPLPIAEIASKTGVSQRQLERDFKEYLDTTATQYYSRLRGQLAKRLLTETSLSITEIGIRTGYNSRSSFIRTYKRLFDKRPSDERRRTLHH
ncbi:GlxA family transcriptional regulator [Marinobacterium maritimum]|uniref:GlxA family transcriptional regulator n=1 Tax=Marinobacterium maritimum TaxID=500162 RepID=A0ABN1IA03_9GAMM